jgi:hypothetical protein
MSSDSRFEVKPNMKDRVGCHGRSTYMACTGPDGGVGQVLEMKSGSGGYEWKCSKCQAWHFQQTNHATQFVPFWHEHLGHEPVYVDSWKTYQKALGTISPNAKNELAS